VCRTDARTAIVSYPIDNGLIVWAFQVIPVNQNSYTKSVEYRLLIRIGKRQEAKGGINNQFLITRFSMTIVPRMGYSLKIDQTVMLFRLELAVYP
jgi:hypothetical protein